MNKLLRILNILPRIGGALSALLILVVFGLISYSVFMRYMMDAPLVWSDELIGYLLVAMAFLGLAAAFLDDRHIVIDLITHKLTGSKKQFSEFFGYFTVLVVAIIFTYSNYESMMFNRSFGLYSVGDLEAPIWVTQIAMVIGSGLLAFAACLKIIDRFVGSSTDQK